MNYSFVQLPYFLDFFPRVLLISVPARMRVQFEGGVHITQQHVPSRVLVRVRSVRHKVLVVASNERSCLSQDLCCGVSCHPSKALQYTRPSSVPQCEYFCTWSSTHLVWISLLCGHYSRAGLILLSSTRAHSSGSIRGREKIEEIRYLALLWMQYIHNQCDEFINYLCSPLVLCYSIQSGCHGNKQDWNTWSCSH